MKEHALEYLSRGWSIIPIKEIEDCKKPYLDSWTGFQKRLPTKEEIETWWTQFSHANIGIITGRISNLVVLDIDDRNSIPNGLPPTLVAETGKGWHYYFKYENGIRNQVKIGDKPLDIRGDGGYVVAPPSIHMSGKRYKWVLEEEMAGFPSHLINAQKQKADWGKLFKGVPDGMRNTSMTSICGKILRGLKPDEYESVGWQVVEAINQRNKPPLPEKVLRATFESIAKRASNDSSDSSAEEQIQQNISFLPFGKILESAIAELDNTKVEDIVSFGYDWLDNHLTGLFPGELVVVGGESGTGKTTFTTNIVYKASEKHRCVVFALEDRLSDYAIKALYFEIGKVKKRHEGVNASNYPWNSYRKNEIQDPNYLAYREEASENLKNDNILFANVECMMTIDILEKLVEEKMKEGVDLFLIDHLHYFDLLKRESTKADYIEQVMVRIKSLQRKTGARIILVVHYKKLEGKKPTLDSFKDSISIVQNANYVVNLWRNRTDTGDKYSTTFSIPKSRNPNGEGTIEVEFDPAVNDYKPVADWKFGTEPGDLVDKDISAEDLDL